MTGEEYYGDSTTFVTGVNVTLDRRFRYQSIILSGAAAANLPDATTLTRKHAALHVSNASGALTLTLRDNDSGVLTTVLAGDTAICHLLDNTTAAGTWLIEEHTHAIVQN